MINHAEIYQASTYVVYSFLAPIITSGGGFLVSNVLTWTGVGLIVATGMTSSYFLVNGLIVVGTFWKDILWDEVNLILPLAAIGSLLGALFLSRLNPAILLALMLYFSLKFLFDRLVRKSPANEEAGLSVWIMALLSGFLAGTALPGGGLRNSYLLSRGYSLPQVHGTTNFIGVILWTIKIATLFEMSILTLKDFRAVWIALPFLFVSNFLLRKGLLNLPKKVSNVISIIAMGLFSVYAVVVLILSIT